MSIPAIAFAKALDLGALESPGVRLLLYVIAENTYDDSFVCRLSQEQMAYEAGRVSDRTVRRHLTELEEARVLIRAPRRLESGQRVEDQIRLVGYKRWYHRDHKRHNIQAPPDNLSGGKKRLGKRRGADTTQMSAGDYHRTICPVVPPDTCCPVATGQQVSGTYKALPSLLPYYPPLTPEGASAGEGEVDLARKVKFAKGWDAEAQEAVAELRDVKAHVVTEFVMPLAGTLSPPAFVDGASWVRDLGKQLGHFQAVTLARLADRMRGERNRDLPGVADLVQLANRIATLTAPVRSSAPVVLPRPIAAIEITATHEPAAFQRWCDFIGVTWGAGAAADVVRRGVLTANTRWPELLDARLIDPNYSTTTRGETTP